MVQKDVCFLLEISDWSFTNIKQHNHNHHLNKWWLWFALFVILLSAKFQKKLFWMHQFFLMKYKQNILCRHTWFWQKPLLPLQHNADLLCSCSGVGQRIFRRGRISSAPLSSAFRFFCLSDTARIFYLQWRCTKFRVDTLCKYLYYTGSRIYRDRYGNSHNHL